MFDTGGGLVGFAGLEDCGVADACAAGGVLGVAAVRARVLGAAGVGEGLWRGSDDARAAREAGGAAAVRGFGGVVVDPLLKANAVVAAATRQAVRDAAARNRRDRRGCFPAVLPGRATASC